MKKTFHSLIVKTPWKQVEACMNEYYPDEDTTFYKRLYWSLCNIVPTDNDSNITLNLDMFEDDEDTSDTGEVYDEYYEVDYPHEITEEQWSFYLGFEIDEDTLKKLPPEEIICHLLFEFLYGEIEALLE